MTNSLLIAFDDFNLLHCIASLQVTEEKDLEVARALLPRLTHNTSLVCRVVASSHVRHAAEAAHISNPFSGALTCNEECLRVFASLEDALRRSCKKLHFSLTYDNPVPLPVSLVAITNVIAHDALLEHLKAAAADINKAASPVVFIVNQQDHDHNFTPTSVASLQREVRDAFSAHSGPVTVILRNPMKVSEGVKEGQSDTEGQPPSDIDPLHSLVVSLLNQTSPAFHGLVLVL